MAVEQEAAAENGAAPEQEAAPENNCALTRFAHYIYTKKVAQEAVCLAGRKGLRSSGSEGTKTARMWL